MSRRKRKAQGSAPATAAKSDPTRVLLWALVAAHVVLGAAVAALAPHEPAPDPRLTPPDESAHWVYVQELVGTWRLPVFQAGGSGNYEAHQPPLYYLTILWCYLAAGDGGLLLARLLGVAMSAVTLLVAWEASRYLLGGRAWARLATVGVLALVPSRLFTIAAVSNDVLAELLVAVALWLALKGIGEGLTAKGAAALGLATGCALLTKTTSLVLVPVVALAVVLEPGWRSGGARVLARNGLMAAEIVAVVWGWWVARNMALYGDPLATGVFQQVFLKDRATPEFFLSRGVTWSGYWSLVAHQTWLSAWGVFGQATVYLPQAFYTAGNVLTLLCATGWGMRAARREQDGADKAGGAAWLVAAALLALTVAAFMRFNTVFYQAQARYLLSASVVLGVLLAGGLCGLAPQGKERMAAAGVVAACVALALWAVAATATGGYSLTPPGV